MGPDYDECPAQSLTWINRRIAIKPSKVIVLTATGTAATSGSDDRRLSVIVHRMCRRLRHLLAFLTATHDHRPRQRDRLPLEVVMASGMYAAFAPRIMVSRYHRLWKAHKWYAEWALLQSGQGYT
jgi:hypothetical protein